MYICYIWLQKNERSVRTTDGDIIPKICISITAVGFNIWIIEIILPKKKETTAANTISRLWHQILYNLQSLISRELGTFTLLLWSPLKGWKKKKKSITPEFLFFVFFTIATGPSDKLAIFHCLFFYFLKASPETKGFWNNYIIRFRWPNNIRVSAPIICAGLSVLSKHESRRNYLI